MIYAFIFVFLLLAELAYLKIADAKNIIDKPNQRSSHSEVTVRGGGIIFPISMLVYFGLFGFQYPWFLLALMLISMISFADDLKHQPRRLRLALHIIAILLTLYQAQYFTLSWFWIVAALVICIALLNAYNFMDGINGITCSYALVVIASLLVLEKLNPFIDINYLYCLAVGAIIFAWFNFRNKARCFAGDVGSISMALALIFPSLLLIGKTNHLLFIGLFGVYGIDAGLTILHRLWKRENITEAHRQHLFQYLANEAGWSHLQVSLLYMGIQLLLSTMLIYSWKICTVREQWLIAVSAFVLLVAIYVWAKISILKRATNNNK
ncbi:MAG TPA: glycosyltransferase family 4 protein [Phnomibacter sp.]|nr:glycosyltransferase family 4 protein [Phnomibacter sp.]